MWSVLSEIENPALRLALFACMIPLLWFMLLMRIAFEAARAPAWTRLRRR
jgi:hypothetical protein